MRGDERVPTTRRIECGLLADSYRTPLAVVSKTFLADILALPQGAVLVLPTAKTPFPLVLSRMTNCRPLYLADPVASDLEWQRERVGNDQTVYLESGATELPDSLQGLGVVLNPFGLQHWHSEAQQYAPTVRKHSRDDALLITLDWGRTRYPEDLADLPGIAEEVRFSEQSLLPPFGRETGWELVSQIEVAFDLQHTVSDIAVLLREEHAETLRKTVAHRESKAVAIGSSILYRRYKGITL